MRTIPPITKRLGTFEVVIPGIELQDGEIVGVFGHSGSGKSTYLREVAHRVGFPESVLMHQDDVLLDYLSARQNIELGLRAAGFTGPAAQRHVAVLADALELHEFFGRRVTALSGGQRRRVYLAQALSIAPELLLLDEPFTGLGWKYERMTCRLLRQRQIDGRETIAVSHDLPFLSEIANRIILISDGKFAGELDPSEPEPLESTAVWAETVGVTNIVDVSTLGRFFELPHELKTPPTQKIGFWRAWATIAEPAHSRTGTSLVLKQRHNIRTSSRTTFSGGQRGCIISYSANDVSLELQVLVTSSANASNVVIERFMWLSES